MPLARKVLVPGSIGLVLIVAFVLHALRPEHPLIDLHLFRNRDLTHRRHHHVPVRDRVLRRAAARPDVLPAGARRDAPCRPGLLVAPQGLGAMLTMPIAGALTDKFPVGQFVLVGLVLDRRRHVRADPARPDTLVLAAHRARSS